MNKVSKINDSIIKHLFVQKMKTFTTSVVPHSLKRFWKCLNAEMEWNFPLTESLFMFDVSLRRVKRYTYLDVSRKFRKWSSLIQTVLLQFLNVSQTSNSLTQSDNLKYFIRHKTASTGAKVDMEMAGIFHQRGTSSSCRAYLTTTITRSQTPISKPYRNKNISRRQLRNGHKRSFYICSELDSLVKDFHVFCIIKNNWWRYEYEFYFFLCQSSNLKSQVNVLELNIVKCC